MTPAIAVRPASWAARDIHFAYRYHVSGDIIKTHTDADSLQLVDLLPRYWQIAQLPENPPAAARHSDTLALRPSENTP